MSFSLSSPAFKEGAAVPGKYTCDGADVSPPLGWSGAPPGTAALALTADDPDAPAGTWVHWVLYNLPGTVSHLPENVPKTETLPDLGGALQGRTDFRRPGYGGPCPPPDRKSTRLNSSHSSISYAVFCLKKKKQPGSSCTCSTCLRGGSSPSCAPA